MIQRASWSNVSGGSGASLRHGCHGWVLELPHSHACYVPVSTLLGWDCGWHHQYLSWFCIVGYLMRIRLCRQIQAVVMRRTVLGVCCIVVSKTRNRLDKLLNDHSSCPEQPVVVYALFPGHAPQTEGLLHGGSQGKCIISWNYRKYTLDILKQLFPELGYKGDLTWLSYFCVIHVFRSTKILCHVLNEPICIELIYVRYDNRKCFIVAWPN